MEEQIELGGIWFGQRSGKSIVSEDENTLLHIICEVREHRRKGQVMVGMEGHLCSL